MGGNVLKLFAGCFKRYASFTGYFFEVLFCIRSSQVHRYRHFTRVLSVECCFKDILCRRGIETGWKFLKLLIISKKCVKPIFILY